MKINILNKNNMSNQALLYGNGIMEFGGMNFTPEEQLQKQELMKEHINLYYDDYYLKPKRKKSSKSKRSQSKRPGAGRCKLTVIIRIFIYISCLSLISHFGEERQGLITG